jgi:hypothetical protein
MESPCNRLVSWNRCTRAQEIELQNLIEERALEIAALPDWDVMPDGRPVDRRKRALADHFTGIAYGTATPLLLHVETWLAQGNRRKPPPPPRSRATAPA